MKEHHGVDISQSAVAKVTLKHAERATKLLDNQPVRDVADEKTAQLILEMDGGMVPLVQTDGPGDRRKNRQVSWSELKVGVIQRLGEEAWKYACSFKSANDLGDRMITLLEREFNWLGNSQLHAVGDGALWITEQLERIAGTKVKYLVDMYHLCEYLAEAATAWTIDVKKETHRLKERFKNGQVTKVKQKLRKYAKEYPEHEGLRQCLQYITNRPGQFDYDKAIEKGLPIGSGKIESTHRHLIQARLKKPGAWWRRDHAANMANLRVLRANNGWESLWQESGVCEDDSLAA